MKRAFIGVLLTLAPLALHAQGKVDFTGFWKKNCEDPFGLQIKAQRGGLYAIAFCKADYCSEPGKYRPDTSIDHDPMYEALGPAKLKVRDPEGSFSTYIKCTSNTHPVLRDN